MGNPIELIFEANLSFTALLLAVMGILISLYLRAKNKKWHTYFKILLVLMGGIFLIGIIDCLLSFYYIFIGFQAVQTLLVNLIVGLFLFELLILGFAGVFLIILLVIE